MHTLFDFIGHLKIQMGKVLAQNTRPCLRCRATGLGKKLEVSDTHREILATVLFWRFGNSEVSRQTKKSPILNDQLSARAARQDHLEIARPNVLLPAQKGLRRSAYYFTMVHGSLQAYYPGHGRLCTCLVHNTAAA